MTGKSASAEVEAYRRRLAQLREEQREQGEQLALPIEPADVVEPAPRRRRGGWVKP